MLKLDFKRVYDSLDHTFLDNILEDLGFGPKWRHLVGCCISTPIISVLVNCNPSRYFGIERGFRHRDPLSPFFFNVVVEGSSALFKKAETLDLLKGVVFDEEVVHVSHLQFADNTISFLQPRVEYLLNAKRILRCFEIVGLLLNSNKTCVVRVGKGRDREEDWVEMFRYGKATFPIMYLGLPLGGRQCSKLFWSILVRRIENRLALWKKMSLNTEGRLVLIKAVMSSILNYYMSVFTIPLVWLRGLKVFR
ncbi:hypothetical protein Ddye_001727 [Dipteronia dyeriana]|uniref:Reverse transcriptase domain-containing protein n=1 Tax=Dipteronia dyeriana TaxID=168575 RepID=A0AAD9XPR5_9ROSI|nr:hypothetical protein Ddye_001727 [Dipteronia dyeriana]